MTFFRASAAILAALLTCAAVLGFAVTESLGDSTAFVASMDEALTRPAVDQEVQGVIRQEILAAGEKVAASSGPLADLARSGASAAADRLAPTVSGPAFAAAWSQWSQLLYEGLADAAVGTTNPQVQVSGSQITVAVGSLVTPVIGDTLAGGLTGALDLFGQDTTVTISTAAPLQSALRAVGALSQWRWILLSGAVALALFAGLAGRSRTRWSGGTLLLAAAATGAAAGLLTLAQQTPPPATTTPQLSLAVTSALTEPWITSLLTATVVLAAAGLVALVISVFLPARSR